MTTAHRRSAGSGLRRMLALAVAAVWLVTGCTTDQQESPSPTTGGATAEEDGFGEPYTILTVSSPDEAETLPHIDEDSLFVQVGYMGGCGEHDFSLQHRLERDTSRLWIRHESAGEASGEPCSRQLYERLRLPMPERAQQAPVMVLLSPSDHPPVILKWGDVQDPM